MDSQATDADRKDSSRSASDETLRSLLVAVSGGCRNSFALLYERTHRRIFGIVLRIVPHRGQAEEVLQDVYAKVWARSDQFDAERGLVVYWLASIAHRAAIDAMRREARRPSAWKDDSGDSDPYSEFASPAEGPAELCEQSQACSLVRAQLRALPADQRESLMMAFVEGLTHCEIAARLSCPLGTIKSRIRRALMSMRPQLLALQ